MNSADIRRLTLEQIDAFLGTLTKAVIKGDPVQTDRVRVFQHGRTCRTNGSQPEDRRGTSDRRVEDRQVHTAGKAFKAFRLRRISRCLLRLPLHR